MKKAFSIILCLVLLFSLASCGSIKRIEPFVWGFSNHNIDNYEKNRAKIEYASDYMPDLNELDGYNAISYSYQYTYLVFFDSSSIALFVEYPKDLYEETWIKSVITGIEIYLIKSIIKGIPPFITPIIKGTFSSSFKA